MAGKEVAAVSEVLMVVTDERKARTVVQGPASVRPGTGGTGVGTPLTQVDIDNTEWYNGHVLLEKGKGKESRLGQGKLKSSPASPAASPAGHAILAAVRAARAAAGRTRLAVLHLHDLTALDASSCVVTTVPLKAPEVAPRGAAAFIFRKGHSLWLVRE